MKYAPLTRTPPKRQSTYFPLLGGVNLTDPPNIVTPGEAIGSQNYEHIESEAGGYRRIEGYERFSGLPRPSQASYWVQGFDGGTDEPSPGEAVKGDSSSAVGIIIAVTVTSGAWATNDAAGDLILVEVSGTFQDNEGLSITNAGFDTGFSSGFG